MEVRACTDRTSSKPLYHACCPSGIVPFHYYSTYLAPNLRHVTATATYKRFLRIKTPLKAHIRWTFHPKQQMTKTCPLTESAPYITKTGTCTNQRSSTSTCERTAFRNALTPVPVAPENGRSCHMKTPVVIPALDVIAAAVRSKKSNRPASPVPHHLYLAVQDRV